MNDDGDGESGSCPMRQVFLVMMMLMMSLDRVNLPKVVLFKFEKMGTQFKKKFFLAYFVTTNDL